MATITERRWQTAGGTERRAWRCTFTDQDDTRVTKQFAKRKDADAWLVQARGRVASGTFTRGPRRTGSNTPRHAGSSAAPC